MGNYKTMLSVGILMLCMVIGITYGTGVLGTMDTSFNMSGSPHEELYDSTITTSIVAFSLAQYLGVILAVILVASALLILKKGM